VKPSELTPKSGIFFNQRRGTGGETPGTLEPKTRLVLSVHSVSVEHRGETSQGKKLGKGRTENWRVTVEGEVNPKKPGLTVEIMGNGGGSTTNKDECNPTKEQRVQSPEKGDRHGEPKSEEQKGM